MRVRMYMQATEEERRGSFSVSEGMSADAEWQQRQAAGYSPVLGSEQGDGTAGL